jgi:hypothetical protein
LDTRDPDRVALVYTEDTRWRNRAEFRQTLYFDESGLLKRHDYDVEIAGGTPAPTISTPTYPLAVRGSIDRSRAQM